MALQLGVVVHRLKGAIVVEVASSTECPQVVGRVIAGVLVQVGDGEGPALGMGHYSSGIGLPQNTGDESREALVGATAGPTTALAAPVGRF